MWVVQAAQQKKDQGADRNTNRDGYREKRR